MWYNIGEKGVEVVEKLQITYTNGTNIVINGCDGTYNVIINELRKKKPAKYVMPPNRSRYKYCISLDNIMCVDKIEVDTIYTIGFSK